MSKKEKPEKAEKAISLAESPVNSDLVEAGFEQQYKDQFK